MDTTWTAAVVLDLTAKAVVIVGLAGVAAYALRRSSAALRHLVWTLAAAALVALPLLALGAPRWPVAVPVPDFVVSWVDRVWVEEEVAAGVMTRREWRAVPHAVPARPPRPARPARPPREVRIRVVPVPGAGPSRLERPRVRVIEVVPAGRPPGGAPPGRRDDGDDGAWSVITGGRRVSGPPGGGPSGPAVLLGVWLAGVLVVCGGVLVSSLRVRRIRRRATEIGAGWPILQLRRVAAELGIRRRVRVLEGEADAMPMTWGVVKPVVLLPSSAREWPSSRVDAVLRHELAHVRRLDALTQLVGELACALHWFNPLAWLVVRRLRAEREMACDDHVVSSGRAAPEYAAQLVALARALRPAPSTAYAAVTMARPGQLRGRVEALLDGGRRRGGVPVRFAVAAWIVVALAIVALSGATPVPRVAAERAAASAASAATVAAVLEAPRAAPAPPAVVRLVPGAGVYAVAARAAAQDALCPEGGARARRVSTRHTDERFSHTWEAPGCTVEIVITGAPRFSEDFTGVASLPAGGWMRLTEERAALRRRLEIAPSGAGVSHTWSVNGRELAVDAEARAWLRAMLLRLFRTTSYAAEDRIAWILREQGAPGLLRELPELTGDGVRRAYYGAALRQPGVDAAAVLQSAAGDIESDHALAELLIGDVDVLAFDEAVRDAFVTASRTLESDHERGRVLAAVLEHASLDARSAAAILESAAEIRSDHEKRRTLEALASGTSLGPEHVVALLDAAATIDSDHDLAQVLLAVSRTGRLMGAPRAAFLRALESIESSRDRERVTRALESGRLD